MGVFVDKVPQVPFTFGEDHYSGTGSDLTKELVENRFGSTAAFIDQLVAKLLGADGNSGYLGNLNNVLLDYTKPTIGDFTVAIPSISVSTSARPVPTMENLDLDFPLFDKTSPTLLTLPTISLDGLTPADGPLAVSPAIDWTEILHDETLFTALLARLITDLQAGATGLDPVVEAEIIARAQARQDIIDDKQEQETLEFYASRGFSLPTGAMQAATAELANERARNRSDLNGKILIEQAELAQKNSQFALSLAKDLEAILRDFTSKRNDNTLDFAKSKAANILAVYQQEVQAWIATEQNKLENIKVQIANMQGVVEYNKGLVTMFSAEGEAYGTVIEGKAKRNEAITGVFKAENVGYEAESRADVARAGITVEEYKLKLQNADIQLRKAIAEIEAELSGYATESSIREKVAEAMANIAMQLAASFAGSLNVSAGLSHQTGRSQSESFAHNEARSVGFDINNSLNEGHAYQEK